MRRNNFDKDFVMKTCLVVSDLPVTYVVKNFTATNLENIQKAWPKIKRAMACAVDLVNSFGIDGDTLTSPAVFLPGATQDGTIVYVFSRTDSQTRNPADQARLLSA